MDKYGTSVKNQLDQAMIEASRLAKLALKICLSLRQAVPFYLFAAEKNQLGQPQRRLPILLINPEPAGLKSNQNKHLTTENVKTCKLVIFSCLVREGFCVLSSSGAAVLWLWSKGSE